MFLVSSSLSHFLSSSILLASLEGARASNSARASVTTSASASAAKCPSGMHRAGKSDSASVGFRSGLDEPFLTSSDGCIVCINLKTLLMKESGNSAPFFFSSCLNFGSFFPFLARLMMNSARSLSFMLMWLSSSVHILETRERYSSFSRASIS